mgnify:CR=1 FL=1
MTENAVAGETDKKNDSRGLREEIRIDEAFSLTGKRMTEEKIGEVRESVKDVSNVEHNERSARIFVLSPPPQYVSSMENRKYNQLNKQKILVLQKGKEDKLGLFDN